MKFEEFMEEIKAGVARRVIGKVSINKVIKNNGVHLNGLTIMIEGENVSPTIYLEPYFSEYSKGKDMEEVIGEVIECYKRNKVSQEMDLEFFTDFEKVKYNIVYKLVNYEANIEMLEDMPHIKYMDLAIIFNVKIVAGQLGNASIAIHNSHLKLWGVDLETIHELAKKNTASLLPAIIQSMDEIISEMWVKEIEEKMGEDNIEDAQKAAAEMLNSFKRDSEAVPMYVSTNSEKVNGATTILYDGWLGAFAEKNQADVYILPSSIHELILILDDKEMGAERLQEMVKEVNRTQVENDEVLSDSIYYYCRENQEITKFV